MNIAVGDPSQFGLDQMDQIDHSSSTLSPIDSSSDNLTYEKIHLENRSEPSQGAANRGSMPKIPEGHGLMNGNRSTEDERRASLIPDTADKEYLQGFHTSDQNYASALVPASHGFDRLHESSASDSLGSLERISMASCSETPRDTLYPVLELELARFIDEPLLDSPIRSCAMLVVWRTIMTRCIILANPTVADHDQMDRVIHRYALPIARKLSHASRLHGLCWYWLGRNAAEVGDLDAAVEALEKALRYGLPNLGTRNAEDHAKDAEKWLARARKDQLESKENRPRPRRIESDLNNDELAF